MTAAMWRAVRSPSPISAAMSLATSIAATKRTVTKRPLSTRSGNESRCGVNRDRPSAYGSAWGAAALAEGAAIVATAVATVGALPQVRRYVGERRCARRVRDVAVARRRDGARVGRLRRSRGSVVGAAGGGADGRWRTWCCVVVLWRAGRRRGSRCRRRWAWVDGAGPDGRRWVGRRRSPCCWDSPTPCRWAGGVVRLPQARTPAGVARATWLLLGPGVRPVVHLRRRATPTRRCSRSPPSAITASAKPSSCGLARLPILTTLGCAQRNQVSEESLISASG